MKYLKYHTNKTKTKMQTKRTRMGAAGLLLLRGSMAQLPTLSSCTTKSAIAAHVDASAKKSTIDTCICVVS